LISLPAQTEVPYSYNPFVVPLDDFPITNNDNVQQPFTTTTTTSTTKNADIMFEDLNPFPVIKSNEETNHSSTEANNNTTILKTKPKRLLDDEEIEEGI
jgi:hypothetical protein